MADTITTTFSDNTEVTAENLNNIAIDLGKADFAVFSADEKFGNDALNQITADLVSSGILNLNDRCKCTLTEDGSQIIVATGVAVFGDGSKIRVTSPQTLDIIDGGTNYVYFKNDTISGRVTLENSLTEPDTTTGYNIMLCTVTDSVLTNVRPFSEARVDLSTTAYDNVSLNETVTFEFGETSYATIEISLPVNKSSYDYIVLVPHKSSSHYRYCMSFYDINNKKCLCSYYEQFGDDEYELVFTDLFRETANYNSYSAYYSIRFVSLSNNTLTLQLYAQRNANTTWTVTFNQTFLLI